MQIRRRINIFRNIVYILTILAALTCLMVLYSDYSAQIPLKVIFFCLVIQFILFQATARRMRVSLVSKGELAVYKDGTLTMALFINKRSCYPFKKVEVQVKYKSRYEEKYQKKNLKIELKDGFKQWEIFDVSGLCCGYNDFTIEKIYLYDAFAFTSIRLKHRYNSLRVVIVPEIEPVVIEMSEIPYLPCDEFSVFSEDNKGKNDEELYEIREFRDGDSLKKVHWKLSSKQDGLIVRDAVTGIETHLYVFFDLCKSIDINKMYGEAVSISYELIRKGYPFYISWLEDGKNKLKRRLVKRNEDIEEVLLLLMDYPLYERNEENIYILRKFMNGQNEVKNLFMI